MPLTARLARLLAPMTWMLLGLIAMPLRPAQAAPFAASATSASAAAAPSISYDDAVASLKRLQAEQDRIKQQTSAATSNQQLDTLDAAAEQLGTNVDNLLDALTPQRAQLQAQLDVLGPPPAAGAAPETPAVARQRADLTARRDQLDAVIKQASAEKVDLTNLNQQFAKLRRGLLRDQLALRSGSLLGPTFWAPLHTPLPGDRQRLHAFFGQIAAQFAFAWTPSGASARW